MRTTRVSPPALVERVATTAGTKEAPASRVGDRCLQIGTAVDNPVTIDNTRGAREVDATRPDASPPLPTEMTVTEDATGEGVLQAARVTASHPSALCASDASLVTTCDGVRQQSCGTARSKRSLNARPTDTSCSKLATYPSAWTGSATTSAMPVSMAHATAVRGAEMPLTELRTAVERRVSKALSPYSADNFERALKRAGLHSKYAHILQGLRLGFDIGMPRIYRTQTPPNKPSLDEHIDHFISILANEINTGRYIGPVSRSTLEQVIGPFQTSPLSIIPKSTPGKFRPIENFSFPLSP